MVKDIIKFYKTFQTGKPDPTISIRQYLENHQYSKEFIDYHFIPLISISGLRLIKILLTNHYQAL